MVLIFGLRTFIAVPTSQPTPARPNIGSHRLNTTETDRNPFNFNDYGRETPFQGFITSTQCRDRLYTAANLAASASLIAPNLSLGE